jgi:hypothetical protein
MGQEEGGLSLLREPWRFLSFSHKARRRLPARSLVLLLQALSLSHPSKEQHVCPSPACAAPKWRSAAANKCCRSSGSRLLPRPATLALQLRVHVGALRAYQPADGRPWSKASHRCAVPHTAMHAAALSKTRPPPGERGHALGGSPPPCCKAAGGAGRQIMTKAPILGPNSTRVIDTHTHTRHAGPAGSNPRAHTSRRSALATPPRAAARHASARGRHVISYRIRLIG